MTDDLRTKIARLIDPYLEKGGVTARRAAETADAILALPELKGVASTDTPLGGWRERAERAEAAISWALGEGDSDFGVRIPPRAPAYWWRAELRERASPTPPEQSGDLLAATERDLHHEIERVSKADVRFKRVLNQALVVEDEVERRAKAP